MSESKRMDKGRTRKWSEAETIKFVELYEAEQVLWNIHLTEYKLKDARDAAAERIIKNINIDGLTVTDIYKKINGIRTTYNQQKARVNRSIETASSPEDVYVPTLAWYEIADRFLPTVHKTEYNHTVTNTKSDIKCEINEETMHSPSYAVAISFPEISNSPRSCSSNEQENLYSVPFNHGKKKKVERACHLEEAINLQKSLKQDASKDNAQEDEFAHFGRNIACQLRQLPLIDALDCQSQMMALLLQKRKQYIKDSASLRLDVATTNEYMLRGRIEEAGRSINSTPY